MKKEIKRKIRKYIRSIRFQVMVVCIILILPLNILSLYQLKSVSDQTVEQIKMTGREVVGAYADTLEKRMENSVSLVQNIVLEEPDGSRMFSGERSEEEYSVLKFKLYYIIRDMAKRTDGADGYFFYVPERDDLLYYESEDGGDSLDVIRTMISENELNRGWHIYRGDPDRLIFFVSLRQVQYGTCIDLDFPPEDSAENFPYGDSWLELTESGNTAAAADETWITASAKVQNMDLTLYIERREKIFSSMWKENVALMTFACLLLIPVLYFLLNRLLLRPLRKVEEAHRELGHGNQDYRITGHTVSSEFEELNVSFNKMADRIYTLTIKEYENEAYRAKMELQNLQLQIRPHFLQNTFNLIYQLSQRGEYKPIENIILYLSEYFRCIFREGNKGVILPKELRLIEQYVQVASIRYNGLVELDMDIDPEVETVRVPPLLLHNFVENSVKYGIRPGNMLYIYMEGRYDGGKVTITIADNGNGMTSDMLERNRRVLRQEETEEDAEEHLGLHNSIRRLKAFYGEEAEITVDSEEGKMACFTIIFPYNLEAEE